MEDDDLSLKLDLDKSKMIISKPEKLELILTSDGAEAELSILVYTKHRPEENISEGFDNYSVLIKRYNRLSPPNDDYDPPTGGIYDKVLAANDFKRYSKKLKNGKYSLQIDGDGRLKCIFS